MYDIEKVISPCADSQPEHIHLPSYYVQRIPPLVNENGIIPEFQSFYEKVVCAIGAIFSKEECGIEQLYELTDMSIDKTSFYKLIDTQWGWLIDAYYSVSFNHHTTGLDVQLNMQRFKDIHRSIIGGFNITTYYTNVYPDSFNAEIMIPKTFLHSTELLFTYKNNKFLMLSSVNSFVEANSEDII